MRFNRSTLILLVGSVIVIIAMVLLSNAGTGTTDTNANATATATETQIFHYDSSTIVSFDVQDNVTGDHILMTKDPTSNVWSVADATNGDPNRKVDQVQAVGRMDMFATLKYQDKFSLTDGNLSQYGLDNPAYTLTETDGDGNTYTVQIGIKNPGATAYYAMTADDNSTVYVIRNFYLDQFLLDLIKNPPYEATPEVTPEVTLESTAEATAGPESTSEATAEATAEMTSEAAAAPEMTTEATAMPEATSTPAPTATPRPTATRVPTATPQPTATQEVTPETTAAP